MLDEAAFVGWLSGHFVDDAEAARFFVEETLLRALIGEHESGASAHLKHERIAGARADAQEVAEELAERLSR